MKKILHQHIELSITQPNGDRQRRVVNFWDDGSMAADYYVGGDAGPMQIYPGESMSRPDALPYSLRWANG